MDEVYEFDAEAESPILKDLHTVDKVGYQGVIKPPTSPLTVTMEEVERDEVYTYYVKGYTPASIAKKFGIRLSKVMELIRAEQSVRAEFRKESGILSLEDSINFYNEIKTQAMERAKYADDKFAAPFIHEAKEAQNAIDKLLGVGTPGTLIPPGGEDTYDADTEGLVVYRERRPVYTEDQLPILKED